MENVVTQASPLAPVVGDVRLSGAAHGTKFFGVVKVLAPADMGCDSEAERQRAQTEYENQLIDIYKAAKNQAEIAPESVHYDSPGSLNFHTDSAEKAYGMCEAWLQKTDELNRSLGRRQQRRVVAVVDVIGSAQPSESLDPIDQYRKAQAVTDLLACASAGQVWVTDGVYQALGESRRAGFTTVKGSGALYNKRLWMRQVVASQAMAAEGALLDVDMARSRQAELAMGRQLDDPAEASRRMRKQIKAIFAGGFERAGRPGGYEVCLDCDAGDGAVFLLPTVADAHAVAVGIMEEAEERNGPAREHKDEAAMRCFRIGISFGQLDEGGSSDPNGETYAQAKRLQEWGPTGEIRMTDEAYRKLPPAIQQKYGAVEQIPGKSGEPLTPGRRFAPVERALWVEMDKEHQEYPAIVPNADFEDEELAVKVRPRCFVVTPLADEPRLNEVFKKLIVPACAKAGYEAVRATQVSGQRNEAIPQNLQESPMVVAYLGTAAKAWNPNVILEIGFRMATKQPLVILGDAHADGSVPDYQTTLPFQLVHHNIITVPPRPAEAMNAVVKEILHNAGQKDRSEWDTPLPILEIRMTSFESEDIIVTDFNAAAETVFGEGLLTRNGDIGPFAAAMAARSDPNARDARREEWFTILERLNTWHRHRTGKFVRTVPQPRVPVVFKDAPINPATGKPDGYLPVVVRYNIDGMHVQARFLYMKVSASMRFDENLKYYVCDL